MEEIYADYEGKWRQDILVGLGELMGRVDYWELGGAMWGVFVVMVVGVVFLLFLNCIHTFNPQFSYTE